jgi:hypothetical protein
MFEQFSRSTQIPSRQAQRILDYFSGKGKLKHIKLIDHKPLSSKNGLNSSIAEVRPGINQGVLFGIAKQL